jgi:hypothetical protein
VNHEVNPITAVFVLAIVGSFVVYPWELALCLTGGMVAAVCAWSWRTYS